jgi:hypothetical protein
LENKNLPAKARERARKIKRKQNYVFSFSRRFARFRGKKVLNNRFLIFQTRSKYAREISVLKNNCPETVGGGVLLSKEICVKKSVKHKLRLARSFQ